MSSKEGKIEKLKQEEPKEIRKLKVMWYPIWDPEAEKKDIKLN
jgi:hypothetical protein